jgi:thiol-disulfide isomerase/thioredoxin
LDLQQEDDKWRAWILNGSERISIPAVLLADNQLVFDIVHYDSQIRATVGAHGQSLEGVWRKRRGPSQFAQMKFHARAGDASRFTLKQDSQPLAANFAGRYAVQFSSSEDPAVAILQRESDGTLSGTFLTTTGDYRYLAGQTQGEQMWLSCFDGAHAFLFSARRQEDGSLRGDFWSRDQWHETFVARPDSHAVLPDAFAQTLWVEGTNLAALQFPDLSGQLRSLDDPQFRGRARLLYVFGSWCPNCHDITDYLVELDRKYRSRGLSILGLAFELTGEFERDAEMVRRYGERHGVTYPLLVAGLADKAKATEQLGALDRVRSYPTTLFLDAENQVQAIHTGFAGPATGEAHQELQRQFEQRIERLLAKAPAPPS